MDVPAWAFSKGMAGLPIDKEANTEEYQILITSKDRTLHSGVPPRRPKYVLVLKIN